MIIQIQKRFSDFDMYGHVNSAIYFTYMEYARIAALYQIFEKYAEKMWFVVAKSSCDHIVPILFNDEVFIEIKAKKVGKSSFDLDYLFKNNQKQFAKGYTTMVTIDKYTKKSTPLTLDIQSYLSNLT